MKNNSMYVSPSMQQLYDTRAEINKRIVKMTPSERTRYFQDSAKDAEKYGIKRIDRLTTKKV